MPVQSSPADTNRLGESQLMLCLQGNMKQTKIIQSAIQITLGELQIVTGQDSLLHFYKRVYRHTGIGTFDGSGHAAFFLSGNV